MVSFFRLNTPFFQQVASTSITMMRRSPAMTALTTSSTNRVASSVISMMRQ
jgi:hypothetical protein